MRCSSAAAAMPTVSHMTATPAIGRPAHELLVRKLMRDGWLLAVAAILIPFLGIWAAAKGWRAWQINRQPAAIALIATGIAVCGARIAYHVLA